MSIKEKLKNWLDPRWNYEIQCDVFEGLNRLEINSIAVMYNIDTNLSRIEICQKLAQILQAKKEEYENVLKRSECANLMDPISGTDVENIDPRGLITITQNGQQYCFEVEGIYENIFINKNTKNPYTNVVFDEETLKFIENEYKKFKILRGKKFDKDSYEANTNLSAIVNQLSNYLPYTVGIDKFLNANRRQINKFLDALEDNYIDLQNDQGVYPEDVDIPVKEDTKLYEYKISLVQEIIKWITDNDYFAVRQAWIYTFQKANDEDDDMSPRSSTFSSDSRSSTISSSQQRDNIQLFTSIYNNDIESLKSLATRGADFSITDMDGMSLLQIALEHDSGIEMLKFLIDNGVDVNNKQVESGFTAIMRTIMDNSYENTKLLIDNGADLDIRDDSGDTPLGIAVEYADKEIVSLLLDNGANPTTINDDGVSPLGQAAMEGDKEIISLLLDHPDVLNSVDIKDIIIDILDLDDFVLVSKLFREDIINPEMVLNEEGDTPLTYSIRKGLNEEIQNFFKSTV